jgi:large subunit ribosomal protein L40e
MRTQPRNKPAVDAQQFVRRRDRNNWALLCGKRHLNVFFSEFSGAAQICEATMSFFVRNLNGQTTTIKLEAGLTVSEAKKQLASKEQIDPSQIRLVFGGKELQDDSSFSDYMVGDGSTVHMALRLKGGKELPPIA